MELLKRDGEGVQGRGGSCEKAYGSLEFTIRWLDELLLSESGWGNESGMSLCRLLKAFFTVLPSFCRRDRTFLAKLGLMNPTLFIHLFLFLFLFHQFPWSH
ncbi:hypothetical protein FRC03_012480 [Tulasnella sp. 419]|nr:hypothetical protein FRC03_012480 [Tulasnella sp. 419]